DRNVTGVQTCALPILAPRRIAITNAANKRGLKSLFNNNTSGTLAPAPPMISAMTAPILIPLLTNASDIGIIVSTRIYIGIPTLADIGFAIGCSYQAMVVLNSAVII